MFFDLNQNRRVIFEDMESLIYAINVKSKLTDEAILAIRSAFQRKKIAKGEVLLSEGGRCNHLYFLESGTIRCFYLNDSTEVTTWFYKEDMFISSWNSFYMKQPSFESIVAVEDCLVYAVHTDAFEQLLLEHGSIERFARLLAQEQVALLDSFAKGYLFLTAKEKYELMLNYFPDIEQRVKLGNLASFLGISQETLSRVRGGK